MKFVMMFTIFQYVVHSILTLTFLLTSQHREALPSTMFTIIDFQFYQIFKTTSAAYFDVIDN